MITLTEFAASKVKEIADEEGVPPKIRAKVQGGGCAGFTYDLSFTEEQLDFDQVFVVHDVTVFIDEMSLQYLEGVVIDYEDNKLGASGFKFKNPNSTGSCGCGNSFSA